MIIGMGTKSALKQRSVESALRQLGQKAEIVSTEVESVVPANPFGFDQIVTGARHRAKVALEIPGASWGLGIETGLVNIEGQYFDMAGICVLTDRGDESISFSAGMFVPDWVIEWIRKEDVEFGVITQQLSGDSEKDPIKYFSADKMKREEMLSQAVMVALNKLINPDRYTQK